MKKMGKGGGMKAAIKQMLGGKGMPDPSKMTPEQMEEAARGMKQGLGMGGRGGFPGMGGGMGLPSGLSGLMKKK
jgi:signal recognition particle subunit SRP54